MEIPDKLRASGARGGSFQEDDGTPGACAPVWLPISIMGTREMRLIS
jgi:hypothetical protein